MTLARSSRYGRTLVLDPPILLEPVRELPHLQWVFEHQQLGIRVRAYTMTALVRRVHQQLHEAWERYVDTEPWALGPSGLAQRQELLARCRPEGPHC